MVAIAMTPLTATQPRITIDACVITVTDLPVNTGSPDQDAYPVQADQRYQLEFRDDNDAVLGRSYVFTPSADGEHTFPNYIWPDFDGTGFPYTGTIDVINVTDPDNESSVADEEFDIKNKAGED